ncbi:MAG: nicotinate-nucleotide adenylyltransferase [Dehalococcoidales bacterium]|nr:nicotinate-nucleotide adenylyltransferase [Dehalococcoidales bacterium]
MGGTFDPVHLGHLAIASEARSQANLASIIFMPAGQPYFKDISSITPSEHRIEMLRLATENDLMYQVSTLEVERRGPSFTVDTLSSMRKIVKPGDEIFFIIGWDSLMDLPSWREPQRIISLCRLIAVPRPGYPSPDISLIENELPGITGRTLVMDKPLIDISSTQVRRMVREGLAIDHLVPATVADYIVRHGLYR